MVPQRGTGRSDRLGSRPPQRVGRTAGIGSRSASMLSSSQILPRNNQRPTCEGWYSRHSRQAKTSRGRTWQPWAWTGFTETFRDQASSPEVGDDRIGGVLVEVDGNLLGQPADTLHVDCRWRAWPGIMPFSPKARFWLTHLVMRPTLRSRQRTVCWIRAEQAVHVPLLWLRSR